MNSYLVIFLKVNLQLTDNLPVKRQSSDNLQEMYHFSGNLLVNGHLTASLALALNDHLMVDFPVNGKYLNVKFG